MDKLKDFIYEISDLLFGASVLLLIILISTYQLHGWFNISFPNNIKNIIPNNQINIDENKNNSEKSTPETKKSNITLENTTDEDIIKENTENKPLEVDEINKNKNTPSTQIEITLRNISITPGSSSDKVANALYENNIITSKENFISRLIELNSETKIKAGSFQIPSNSSVDEVIQIITQ